MTPEIRPLMAINGESKRFALVRAGKTVLTVDTSKTLTTDALRAFFVDPKKAEKVKGKTK